MHEFVNDSHNHLQKFDDPATVISEMQAAGVVSCVVNGTGETDWNAVADLAETYPDFVRPAFGVHPWEAHLQSGRWKSRLEDFLDRFPQASVGECGLDGWVSEPPLDVQRELFLPQIAIARERELPLTIHALKAWQPLFDAFEKEAPPEKFLLHSFGGSVELIERLTRLGAYFSFSGYFLHPRKSKVLGAFKSVPHDKLLLETDGPEMTPPPEFMSHLRDDERNHPANLPKIAEGLAETLGMEPSELEAMTSENHRRFFGIK